MLARCPDRRIRGIGRVPEDRNTGQLGNNLLEQLQTLWAELPEENRASRDVPTWLGQARNDPVTHRIDRGRKNDRDRPRRILCGEGSGRREHDNDVDLEADHLRGKLLEALRLPFGVSSGHEEIPTFDISARPKLLIQGVFYFRWCVGD